MSAPAYPLRKQGPLVKLGYKSHKWQERWFDLQPEYLLYYSGFFKVVANGRIDLVNAQVALAAPDETIDPRAVLIPPNATQPQIIGRNNAIKILSYMEDTGVARVWYLVCANPIEREEWINALENNIEYATQVYGAMRQRVKEAMALANGGSIEEYYSATTVNFTGNPDVDDKIMTLAMAAMGISDEKRTAQKKGKKYKGDFFEGRTIPDDIGWWVGVYENPLDGDDRVEIPPALIRTRNEAVNCNSIETCKTRGLECYNAKQWRLAWDWFTRALLLDPNDPKLWANRAATVIMFVRERRWKNIFEWSLATDALLEACKDAYEATTINHSFSRAWMRLCVSQMMVVPDLLMLPLAAYSEGVKYDAGAALPSEEFSGLFLVPHNLLVRILPLGGKVVPDSYELVVTCLKSGNAPQFNTYEGGHIGAKIGTFQSHFFASSYTSSLNEAAYLLYMIYARLRSCFCGSGKSALGGETNFEELNQTLISLGNLVPLRPLLASPCVEEFLLNVDLRARDLIEIEDMKKAAADSDARSEVKKAADSNEHYDKSPIYFAAFVCTVLARMANEKAGNHEKALIRLIQLGTAEITRISAGLHLSRALIAVAQNASNRRAFIVNNGLECLACDFSELAGTGATAELKMDVAKILGEITEDEAKHVIKSVTVAIFSHFIFPILDGEMAGCHLYKDLALKCYKTVGSAVPLQWIHEGGPELSSFSRYIKGQTSSTSSSTPPDLTVPLSLEALEGLYTKFSSGEAVIPQVRAEETKAPPTISSWNDLS